MANALDVEPAIARRRGPAPNCSLGKAIEVLSTRSAFLLLREAFYGTTRFEDFVMRTGISEPVAATRLKELVAAGLLAREPYREPGQRTRSAYTLTEMGADLLPAVIALLQWGDRWLTDGAGGPVAFSHRECGEPVSAQLRCGGGHPVAAEEIRVSLRDRRD